jgi:TolB protein
VEVKAKILCSILVFLLFAAAWACTEPDGPVGNILFSSDREGQYDIYVMNADGGGVTRLTSGPANDYFPEILPGTRVFSFVSVSRNPPDIGLWVQNLDNPQSAGVMLKASICGSPAFSPDGRYLAVTLAEAAGDDSVQHIWVLDLRDGRNWKITAALKAGGSMPQWSPDGKLIAFVSAATGYQEIYIMYADGSGVRQVTRLNAISGDPSWSPDGSAISFFTGTNANTQIATMKPDGSSLKQLTGSLGHNGHPRWSPDGKWIAFWSNRSGKEQIYIIDSAGTQEMQLTEGTFNNENPTWSP